MPLFITLLKPKKLFRSLALWEQYIFGFDLFKKRVIKFVFSGALWIVLTILVLLNRSDVKKGRCVFIISKSFFLKKALAIKIDFKIEKFLPGFLLKLETLIPWDFKLSIKKLLNWVFSISSNEIIKIFFENCFCASVSETKKVCAPPASKQFITWQIFNFILFSNLKASLN